MALINCPECGREISDKAAFCPHCGYSEKDMKSTENVAKGEIENEPRKRININKRLIVKTTISISILVVTILVYILFSKSIPNIVGKDVQTATNILEKRGIKYKIISEYTENYENEIVYEQSIKPHTLYDTDEKIVVSVSKGKVQVMPDIVGKNIKDFETVFDKMSVEYRYLYTDALEKGVVISASVDEGEPINENTKLIIRVSEGKYNVLPDLTKMNVEEAKRILDEIGIKYKIEEGLYGIDNDLVYKFSPKKYGNIEETTITLQVSKGTGIQVPLVEGKTKSEAEKILKDAGFKSKVIYDYGNLRTDPSEISNILVQKQNITGYVEKPCEVELSVPKPSIKISYVGLDTNYVGGFDTYLTFENMSDKQIAYITFQVKYYDRMGYPAECEIKDTCVMNLEYTGPLNAGSSSGRQYWDAVIYNSSAAAIEPLSAKIQFTDGTSQTLTYGNSFWHTHDYYGGELH